MLFSTLEVSTLLPIEKPVATVHKESTCRLTEILKAFASCVTCDWSALLATVVCRPLTFVSTVVILPSAFPTLVTVPLTVLVKVLNATKLALPFRSVLNVAIVLVCSLTVVLVVLSKVVVPVKSVLTFCTVVCNPLTLVSTVVNLPSALPIRWTVPLTVFVNVLN